MAHLLLFAAIKDAAGTSRCEIAGATVGEVLTRASASYGPQFERLLPYCNVMVGEERVDQSTPVSDSDEIAILPPVSGG